MYGCTALSWNEVIRLDHRKKRLAQIINEAAL
jgi:hypothetical protein